MEIGESVVQAVILHQVGNRLREEPLILADECFALTDSISNVILGGYLRGIVSDKNQYILSHESDIALNAVAHHISKFFIKEISFVDLSQKLATHLYASTHHPNVAAGDLFVILFDKIKIDGNYQSAVGIYKSESKQQYLSAYTNGKTQKLEVSSGINPDFIDKGALIIDESHVIYAIDRLSNRTKYWIDDFLKAKQIPNESTKSSVAAGLIETVQKKIKSPMAQQNFFRDVVALCADRDEVLEKEIREVSEKYISPKVWITELDKIVERKGLVDTGEISVSSRILKKKLKKIFNRITLDNDISLIIPDIFLLIDVYFKINGKYIEANIILENKNG